MRSAHRCTIIGSCGSNKGRAEGERALCWDGNGEEVHVDDEGVLGKWNSDGGGLMEKGGGRTQPGQRSGGSFSISGLK